MPKALINIPSLRLRQAIDKLKEPLGDMMVDVLVYDFNRQGIRLEKDAYYSLEDIEQAIRRTFSRDAAALIIEKLRPALL